MSIRQGRSKSRYREVEGVEKLLECSVQDKEIRTRRSHRFKRQEGLMGEDIGQHSWERVKLKYRRFDYTVAKGSDQSRSCEEVGCLS